MVTAPGPELEKAPPLYERAYDRLRARILAGDLRPGERLLDTRLAGQLGVSRTPVRDALRQLVRDRLVDTDVGGRFFVARPDRVVFLEFCACRELLEPEATAMAARHATPAELEALAASLERSSRTLHGADPAAAARTTVEFHNALATATHNRLLAELLGFIRAPVLPLRGIIFANSSGAQATEREHWAIYAAVAARDPEAAATAARAHIDGDRERGLRALEQLTPQADGAESSAGSSSPLRHPAPSDGTAAASQ